MKLTYLLPLLVLAGCASKEDPTAATPDADVKLTTQEKIDKIQNDPKIPEGLKQIQIDTLQRQPGAR